MPDIPSTLITDFGPTFEAFEYKGKRYPAGPESIALLQSLPTLRERAEVVCIAPDGLRIFLAKIDACTGDQAVSFSEDGGTVYF